jgi:hypothetical protein
MAGPLSSELDPAAEAGRLAQWTASYRTSGGTGSWLAPRREAAEQWHAVIRGIVRVDIDRGDLADLGLLRHRPVGGTLTFRGAGDYRLRREISSDSAM